jgi:hypothetical protein
MAIRIGPATDWMEWSADNSMSACRIRRTKGSASIAGLTGKRWMIVGMLQPRRMVCTRDHGRDITWPEMWGLGAQRRRSTLPRRFASGRSAGTRKS